MQNKNAQIHFIILKKDQQGRARLLMMFCRFCDMMMMPGSKGQKAVHACMIRLLNLGPAKHEKVAIYVVNQRISNVCRIAGAASQRSNS